VIYDDNKFRSDQLQTLLYHQSYVFARSSTSVSLRTPFPLFVDIDPAVYYAHLAGNRAKVRDESLDVDDGTATSASTDLRNMRLEDIPISRLKPMHAALNGGDLAMWYL
jgi:eukaryotic translation initiation factor 2C